MLKMSKVETTQKRAYNNSLKYVEQTNKEIAQIYADAMENINKKILTLKAKAENGLLNEFEKLRLKRLNDFIQTISIDIRLIKESEAQMILQGFVDNYSNGYYGNAYAIEYGINVDVLKYEPYGYSVYSRKLNTSYIAKTYNENVANKVFGMTLKQKTEADILGIQKKLRQAVTQAITEGISPKQLSKRFKDMGIIFDQSKNHAMTVARTELLRGYSYGNQESIDEAYDAGVDGVAVWDSTLDGKTRPAHQTADQQKAVNGYFTVGGEKTRMPRGDGMSAKHSVNCRCVSVFTLTDLGPNSRGYRSAEGKWEKTNANLNYQEWAETLGGKKSIEQSQKDAKARDRRLKQKNLK
jgi:hypothetical protein